MVFQFLFIQTPVDKKLSPVSDRFQTASRSTFTSPSTLQTADITFLTTTTTAGNTVAAGATIIPVDALIQSTEDLPGSGKKPVAIGDSISQGLLPANAEIVSIGTTTVTISTGSTSASAVAAGTAVTFTQRTRN